MGVTTVDRWSGREARLLRHALRLTVRAFAEDLGVCVRTVSKWEATGAAMTPRPELQAALDTMLRRATEEDRERFRSTAGIRSNGIRSVPVVSPGAAEPVAPQAPGVITLDVGPSEPPVGELPVAEQHVVDALADAQRYLDAAAVDYFRRQLLMLKSDAPRLGSAGVLPLLLGMLGAITEHAAQVRPDVRRGLLNVGADGAELAGWLYQNALLADPQPGSDQHPPSRSGLPGTLRSV